MRVFRESYVTIAALIKSLDAPDLINVRWGESESTSTSILYSGREEMNAIFGDMWLLMFQRHKKPFQKTIAKDKKH